MATTKRPGLPYFYVTWLSGLLAGENSCRFKPWLKSHFKIDEIPSSFDFAKWSVEHTALLNQRVQALKAEGWTVKLEAQNKFTLQGNTATIGGKCDIVARRGERILVSDAKSGAVRNSNAAQVAIYMLVLPLVWGQPDLQLEGEVVYKTAIIPVPWADVVPMRDRLFTLIRELAVNAPPAEAVPSQQECGFCDVSKVDCPQRFGEGAAVDVMTSEF